MFLNWFWALVCLLPSGAFAAERVRHVAVIGDQIVPVRTAIGIATIIQVPDRPNSVVVGDQESFKVEYLDQAITIKPLRGGAKSNLYVYTDFRRYNVQLLTGGEDAADFVVYLQEPKSVPLVTSKINWTNSSLAMVGQRNLKFRVIRYAKTSRGLLMVEFQVSALSEEEFDPATVWITQNSGARPIQNLVLSGTKVSAKTTSSGVLELLTRDLDEAKSFSIELRLPGAGKSHSYPHVTLPRINSWK